MALEQVNYTILTFYIELKALSNCLKNDNKAKVNCKDSYFK